MSNQRMKLIVAGLALFGMLPTTVSAAELPQKIRGRWCEVVVAIDTEVLRGCNKGNLYSLSKDRVIIGDVSCVVDKVEQHKRDGWLGWAVTLTCKGIGHNDLGPETWNKYFYPLVDGYLAVRRTPAPVVD